MNFRTTLFSCQYPLINYPNHTQVCGYLKNYTAHFGLEKFIHLNSVVKHVVPHKGRVSLLAKAKFFLAASAIVPTI